MGPWLLLLCGILTIWNPAVLALRLSAAALNASTMSTAALVYLGARLVITSIGVSAGISLFMQRSWAVRLTKAALLLFCVEAVVLMATRIDLSEAPPGTRGPRALVIIVHSAAWYLYLQKSRRVRRLFDLESLPTR